MSFERFTGISKNLFQAINQFRSRKIASKVIAQEIARLLDVKDILQGVQYAAVGGIASQEYGSSRETHDIDILIRNKDSDLVQSRLTQNGFNKIGPITLDMGSGTSYEDGSGLNIDVIELSDAWVHDALQRVHIGNQGLPIVPIDTYVFMKLLIGRGKDLVDVLDAIRVMGKDKATQISDKVVELLKNQGYDDAVMDWYTAIAEVTGDWSLFQEAIQMP